jgi:hypothetical protein
VAGGVRANWFVEIAAEGDPLSAAVEEVGVPLDLDDEEPLQQELVALGAQEHFLYDLGVECAVKDQPDTTCHACPLQCADGGQPISPLCKVGLEQERVTTQLAVMRHAKRQS